MIDHPTARVLLGVLILCSGSGRAQELPRLNFSNREWPPYFVGEKGFARELLETCLPPSGYVPRFSAVNIEQTFLALQNGVLDGHVLARSESRERYLHFGSEPLFVDSYQPVVRSDSGIQIRQLQDFDRLRVGYLPSSRSSGEFAEYLRHRKLATVAMSNHEALVQALLEKQIDVFVGLAVSTRLTLAQRKVESRVTILPWAINKPTYVLAISRRTKRVARPQAFLAAFDACIRRIRADGTYERLRRQYGAAAS